MSDKSLKTTEDVQVGEFIEESLFSDTEVFEVVGKTAKSLKIRKAKSGELVKRVDRNGNGWTQDWNEAVPDFDQKVKVVRQRKDGTFRYNNGKPLRKVSMVHDKPCFFTDYRY